MEIVQELKIELDGKSPFEYVEVKEGDRGSRVLAVTLLINRQPYTIPEGCTARIKYYKPDGFPVLNDCRIEGNKILVAYTEQMLAAAGTAKGEIVLEQGESALKTATFYTKIVPAVYRTEGYTSDKEFLSMGTIFSDMDKAAEAAAQEAKIAEAAAVSANDAAGVANTAGDKAIQATSNAEKATAAAETATGQVTAAKDAATAAAKNANDAADRTEAAKEDIINSTNEAKRAAEQASKNAQGYAAQAERAVGGFDRKTADAAKKIEDSGTQQQERITQKADDESARLQRETATALEDIKKKGTEQIGAVTAAGEVQTEAVRKEGTAQSEAMKAEGEKQIQAIINAGGGIENALANYFNLRRTGKIFSTKFYKYATSQSPAGEKMNDNEGMICEPSTDTISGRDDYQKIGLFQHFTCNWEIDPEGFIHITALEGDDDFRKTGAVQVGEVTCSGWIGVEDREDHYILHYSDKQSKKTPTPIKESVNPDGSISPWIVHAKYLAVEVDGKPYSSAGECPANYNEFKMNNTSYTGQATWMKTLGEQYGGLCSCDIFYRQLMLMIKYATTNSQSVMAGCLGYTSQYKASVPEQGVTHVTMKTSEANKYCVDSYVSVGEMGEQTSNDRYKRYMHDKAYDVRIKEIRAIDDANSVIELDADIPFDTTLTTCVSTFHWRTGSTDCVRGSDGSPGSNTDMNHPCKIQGIEFHLGGYEVLGNAIMDIITGADGIPMRDVYVCDDARKISTNIERIRTAYKKARTQIPYTKAAWKYISAVDIDSSFGMMIPKELEATGSSTGFCDGVYTDTATSGQREFLCGGRLRAWSNGGLWYLYAYGRLTYSYWSCLAGVSPNSCRGEYPSVAG